ncbi:Gamma-aminobutyric acid receptor subunit rho-1 GABA(A) receptor subunit rho-1 GABA(C) receptor [Takifugu flavidus]|uniref:Gamma-aminobutyric acid receptor subunit rho-1 GABA(A) receptor subunit rho-1 GABA(C) receptor n=1 Tax=Takifugu flavidus TaxID=433684 RepID=A0A5C6NT15_9TELE|nr:Gamma-aminobutyric acid receptor subunit rho-1 GABA(A) receptor subunit rho-1 GABA(C) receptor [Takifugu flavidus]
MKLGAVTCLVLAAASVVAMVTGGRNSGRRKQKEVFLEENSKFKFGGRIDHKLKRLDSTKTLLIKSEQLLRIEEHDFAMRPGFGVGQCIKIGTSAYWVTQCTIGAINLLHTHVGVMKIDV